MVRKAKDLDGNIVYVHLVYVDKNHEPMMLIESQSGKMRTTCAEWIEFLEPPEEKSEGTDKVGNFPNNTDGLAG